MKKEKLTINKIEIDSETNEAYITKVDEKNLINDTVNSQAEQPSVIEPINSIGEQLVMSKIFNSYDHNNEENAKITKRKKTLKVLSTILFIVLIVGVLAYTFYKDFFSGEKEPIPKEVLFSTLSKNWPYILLAVFSCFMCYVFKGLRLSFLCKNLTGKYHFILCLKTAVFGLCYNYMTPFAIGGPPSEIVYMASHNISSEHASSIPLSSYVIHQICLVLMVIVSLVFYTTNAFNIPYEIKSVFKGGLIVPASIGLFFSLLIPFWVVVFSLSKKFGEKIISFVFFLGSKLKIIKDPKASKEKAMISLSKNAECIMQVAKKPSSFILAIVAGIGEQLALMSIAYFSLKTFGLNWEAKGFIEWIQILQMCFLLQSAVSFIPTPGNSGAADLSFYLLFEKGLALGTIGLYSVAFPAMMTWRFLCFYTFILVGVIAKGIKKGKKLKAKRK
ncbi:MAG: flippase-like domain-containing protein [Clostridia bacterium]|nr:flippase-like domain-containing protein [Clostridia bacterium]